jgi:hypothetical protein
LAEDAGGNKETDVLEDPKVKEAIEAARKEANSEGYRKGQSDTDKATQEALSKAETAEKKLAELENQRFENLSDEDKQKEIINRLWKKEQNPDPVADDKGKSRQDPAPTDPNPADPKSKLVEAAKEAGLDPEKLDFSNGTEAFLRSWTKELRDGKSTESESSSEEDDKKSKSGGPVDRGGGAPASTDITKVNPNNIFANAYNKNHGGD